MRRLSIIDLDGGWQPIYNEDRSLAVICNGEIYNYVELTRELKNRGHHFSTQSDVETIVHLYEEYQLDFVKHLRGMFAIALWDDKKKRLILARDRMGEKPIYLVEREKTLFFASELKAILKSSLVPLELDPIAVNQYFHFQYVPEPNTIVKGVRKLPAAHVLVVDTQPWKVVEHRYWAMEDAPPLRGEPTELIEAELERVSKIVIRSDVPIGLALSGGVDSAVVASFVVNTYPGILQAFSIGYEGNVQSDERKEAQALAAHFGVKFHGVEIRDKDMVNFFPKLVFWRDDPIADISGHGYYMVQKAASDAGIKVMLQGQGGDEFFWGYDWVRQALAENRIRGGGNSRRFLSSFKFTGPTGFSRAGMGPFIRSYGGLLTSWAKYKRVMAKPEERVIFYDLSRDFNNASKTLNRYTSRDFQEATLPESPYKVFTVKKPWPALDILITKLIAETYLLENGVTQGDRLGMASSVELRLPLLDYKLVETVIGLRKSQPDDHLPPKEWLKGAAASRIPEKFLDKPKRGFEPPVRRWHQAIFGEYGDQLRDGFLVKQDVLSPMGAEQLAEGPFNKFDIVPLSFKALVLETWARQMLS
jgi:asparagine synthase (glutamine-hydrolysing)